MNCNIKHSLRALKVKAASVNFLILYLWLDNLRSCGASDGKHGILEPDFILQEKKIEAVGPYANLMYLIFSKFCPLYRAHY